MANATEKAFWKGLLGGFMIPVLVAVGAVTGALPIMLALGVWHAEIDERVPALGFWPVFVISWGLGSLITKFRHKYDFSGK
jgi:hypothetical protein